MMRLIRELSDQVWLWVLFNCHARSNEDESPWWELSDQLWLRVLFNSHARSNENESPWWELSDQLWLRVLFNSHARSNKDESPWWELSDQLWLRVLFNFHARSNENESWGASFGWEFCSTLMRGQRGWELDESWETRFGWEFCSTLMSGQRGWELCESWETSFGREFCFMFNSHVPLIEDESWWWQLSDQLWLRERRKKGWAGKRASSLLRDVWCKKIEKWRVKTKLCNTYKVHYYGWKTFFIGVW